MTVSKLLAGALIGAVGLASAMSAVAEDNRYIVQFAPGAAGNGKAAIQAAGGRIERDLTQHSINAVAITIPSQALEALSNNPNVVNVEVDERVYPMADQVPFGIPMVQADLVSDAFVGNQKVCIIDSGYQIGHSDLQSTNVTGDFLAGSGDPFIDSCGHGTHVAGTIAALANGSGVVGVMPSGNIALHIVKVFGDDNWTSGSCGWSYNSDLIAAAYECRDAGATVINMSLGGGGATSAAAQAFQDLADQGILSIAAAGNDGTTQMSYPASYDAVVSVGAIDVNGNLGSFSQRNSQVELAAPGVDVISTVPYTAATVNVDRDYTVSAMDRSAQTTASGGLVDGGLCTSAGNWSGQVVLCERGSVSFSEKVSAVEAGGGVAAIVYNNEPGGFGGLLDCKGNPNSACSSIPAVSMSQADGQSLVANQLGASAFVSTVYTAPADGYDSYNGTSMATPHVAAVAALVWSYAPDMTVPEIRQLLTSTALDLGTPGRDNDFGFGLVQAQAAIDALGGGGPDPDPNAAPTAAFSFSCNELACSFDGSGSSDSDGSIASYSWNFGDGNGASGASASHSFAADGSYSVTLTVTDNDGASDSVTQQVTVATNGGGGDPSGIELTGVGYKVQGRWRADLSWSGAQGGSVDIVRNGSVVTTTANDGAYTDATSFKGGGTLTYQVCEAGTSNCSATVTLIY
ncbi:S8 family serine peptidase [Wenzhouxiangella marina]|uniref:Serine peptidase n=1 Tax=Wenzhouxiangella marina TaxID=1579979 RepID=A0A0K0XS79_9GAMM|nr:S8 family serine peptidase [Wenzhouxiangella marina]AKS40477.1 serine peptidase [Wenzhouxiangella marina]MBB6088201.1 subtilisin family serine protease [Wenzhouxiangella marina]